MKKVVVLVLVAVVLAVPALNVNAKSAIKSMNIVFMDKMNKIQSNFYVKRLRGRKAFSVSELDGTFEVDNDRNTVIGKPLVG